MIEGIPASRLAGFDLPNEESGYSELCDSGYQVAGPEGWESSVLPGIPSLGPFDLNEGTYTGCMYNGYEDPGLNGTLTCDGGNGWACVTDFDEVQACGNWTLSIWLYCPYTF